MLSVTESIRVPSIKNIDPSSLQEKRNCVAGVFLYKLELLWNEYQTHPVLKETSKHLMGCINIFC